MQHKNESAFLMSADAAVPHPFRLEETKDLRAQACPAMGPHARFRLVVRKLNLRCSECSVVKLVSAPMKRVLIS